MTDPTIIVGDIGGTNARFALADKSPQKYRHEIVVKCADFASPHLAIDHYLKTTGTGAPSVVCLAVAGPVINDTAAFTNNDWKISSEELCSQLHCNEAVLLNDFAAIAHSIPALTDEHMLQIGNIESKFANQDNGTIGILGPGTGLGTVALKKDHGNTFTVLPSEAGHVGFAPANQKQQQVLALLQSKFDRVSIERVISGPGIENIYSALQQLAGKNSATPSAAEIFDQHINDNHKIATDAVGMFFEVLGQAAGDFGLSIAAHDGIYLAGGIAQRYPTLLENSAFRNAFEAKGRYRDLMKSIPTVLITHPQPGLLGAASWALKINQR